MHIYIYYIHTYICKKSTHTHRIRIKPKLPLNTPICSLWVIALCGLVLALWGGRSRVMGCPVKVITLLESVWKTKSPSLTSRLMLINWFGLILHSGNIPVGHLSGKPCSSPLSPRCVSFPRHCDPVMHSFSSGKLADSRLLTRPLKRAPGSYLTMQMSITVEKKAIHCLPRVVPGMKKRFGKDLYAQNRGSGMCVNFQGSMRPRLLWLFWDFVWFCEIMVFQACIYSHSWGEYLKTPASYSLQYLSIP